MLKLNKREKKILEESQTVKPTVKGCPFCGNNDQKSFWIMMQIDKKYYAVQCTKCMTRGPIAFSSLDAALFWNIRSEKPIKLDQALKDNPPRDAEKETK